MLICHDHETFLPFLQILNYGKKCFFLKKKFNVEYWINWYTARLLIKLTKAGNL